MMLAINYNTEEYSECVIFFKLNICKIDLEIYVAH